MIYPGGGYVAQYAPFTVSGVITAAIADVIVRVRGDVGIVSVREDGGVMRMRSDVGSVAPDADDMAIVPEAD